MNKIDYKENAIWECVSNHKTQYPNPITLSKGEMVKLGELAPEENWKDWIWAENSNGQGGWVPIQLINKAKDGLQGVVNENYSAKELNLSVGESVVKIKSLNNWTWLGK